VTGTRGNVARIDVGYRPAPVSAAARHIVTQIRDLSPRPALRPLRRLYARYGIRDEIQAERAGVPD
jgi:hypothetical protein